MSRTFRLRRTSLIIFNLALILTLLLPGLPLAQPAAAAPPT